ncbi:hypothetical protein SFRURICE_011181 [Spodoptera frugiperda]|uniref:SFRICE_037004 n=1 Tax=Spodoptera frugiperda TaxID=7108 RepID=A0A2H1WVQ4_SPOFR|nr:hypothetical protein SFRURICE_011181 [Spodoptera frugiperda]
MTEAAHRLSTSKSTDDVINILHRTYEVNMRINTDRKSQRTTVGQKARQADHLAWSEDPPFLRELYSQFPKGLLSYCLKNPDSKLPDLESRNLMLLDR